MRSGWSSTAHTAHLKPGKEEDLQVFQGRFPIFSLVKYMRIIYAVDYHEPWHSILALEPVSHKLQNIHPRVVPSR